jgi:uncharacterized membrane protein YbaN (DUF454 family)
MYKLFFAGCGWVFVLVGVIGIFIPLLPTTPFLLLAAFCFHKSSERFHGWLLNHKVLGPPVKNWTEHRIISKKAKVTATTLILTSGIYLFYKDSIPLYGRLSAGVILALVVIFLWSQRSE